MVLMLSGKQGAGKTTLSNLLQTNCGVQGFKIGRIYKFADPIYAFHNSILDQLMTYGIQPVGPKDGRLLQLLGTEWGRHVLGEDVWIRIMKNRLEKADRQISNTLFIIDDCRFQNEFDAFPDALRIRLFASERIRKERTQAWRDTTEHQSETDLDDYEEDEKFDMVLNTSATNPVECMDIIFRELRRRKQII